MLGTRREVGAAQTLNPKPETRNPKLKPQTIPGTWHGARSAQMALLARHDWEHSVDEASVRMQEASTHEQECIDPCGTDLTHKGGPVTPARGMQLAHNRSDPLPRGSGGVWVRSERSESLSSNLSNEASAFMLHPPTPKSLTIVYPRGGTTREGGQSPSAYDGGYYSNSRRRSQSFGSHYMDGDEEEGGGQGGEGQR
jgi:hypothetical protein